MEGIRPTKKQYELLKFIEDFIEEHGYSPSYREIMAGSSYNSVATVAEHVNNLIARGHLRKRGRSARSLEVVNLDDLDKKDKKSIKASESKWLVEQVEWYFEETEKTQPKAERDIDHLYVLVGALKVLGMEGAWQSFLPRLATLRDKVEGKL